MTPPTDLPVHRFADQAAFEAWLEAEHERSPGIYVVIAKKGAPEPTLKQAEMVESLLCFGWIDGRANRLDDHHFTTRVTPRRPKSVWSKKNVEWVGRLVEARAGGETGIERVRRGGATLLDVQWVTPHLASLGAVEVPRSDYLRRLADAVEQPTPALGSSC